MRPAYIAAPYAGQVADNVRRAAAVSRWACDQGLAPICVHPAIAAGAYGSDDVPATRERGLAIDCLLVEMVADRAGVFVRVLDRYGNMSDGVRREYNCWHATLGWQRDPSRASHCWTLTAEDVDAIERGQPVSPRITP